MSHLPIIIPGPGPIPTRTVNVPCSLPESMSFDVFLPDRGVRRITAFWKSTDPLKAEVSSVALANPETNGIRREPYEVSEDEEQRMQDAAGDVLRRLLDLLHICEFKRVAGTTLPAFAPLPSIARACLAECEAFEAQVLAAEAMPRAAGQVLALNDPGSGAVWTPARALLAAYVTWAVEQACKAQDAKARRESESHLPSGDEDVAGSERMRNERGVLP